MIIIGLTGGIGSGKSSVARYLEEEGFPIIDADRVGHELLDSPSIQDAIVALFGNEVLEEGTISREKLGMRVFADTSLRNQLNALLHPLIKEEIARWCAQQYEQGNTTVVVEAALLREEEGSDPWLSGLILVLSTEENRVTRLVTKRNMSEEEARSRIKAQVDPDTKIPRADWIVYNDGDFEHLKEQTARMALALRALGNAAPPTD